MKDSKLKNYLKYFDSGMVFSMVIVCLISALVWLNVSVEKKRLVVIEKSLRSYMDYLKDMIFNKAHIHLKKGEMKAFKDTLREIGTYEYVNEFSLVAPDGFIKYSSDERKRDTLDFNIKTLDDKMIVEDPKNIRYYLPVLTTSECTGCHSRWKIGSVSSYYKVSLSRQALIDISNFTQSGYLMFVFSGAIVLIFFYMFYHVIRDKISEEHTKESEEKFRTLFENIIDVQYRTDIDGNLTLISPSGITLLGYSSEEQMIKEGAGRKMFYSRKERTRFLKTLAYNGSVKDYEIRLKKRDGTPVTVEMNTKVIYDDLRNPVSIEGVFRDVTERKEYEKQLEQMAIVFDTAVESIIILNSKGIIEKVNPAFTVITGYKPTEIIGKSPKILRSEKHKESFYIGIQKKLFRTGLWQGEIWNRKVNGETYPEWLSVTCIKDNTGSILHYVLVGHDITELKRSEEKLKHQVYHDSLTGLPNRELLKDRIDMALAYSTRHKTKLAILFIDLDNFKNINDTAGHQVGDVYLRKIAEMLSCSCREEDTVSRIGGDEFVILLPDAEHDNSAEKVAKRIFKAFNTHVVIDEYKLSPSASIGISIFPENGDNPTDLLRAADMAMYHSKEKGKGSYAFYQPDMDTSDIDKLSIEANIRKGIKNNEFLMHYQPVVSLSDGRVKGFEALVRWQKSDGTLIPPAQFINVAEESHLIHKLGDFVLKETCEAMKKISKIGYKQLSFSVNVSSKQFQNYNFVENVIKTVKETGIKAEKLILEITENTVVNDINTAIRTMKELKEQGIRMSLDDFGTGYSSLAYLKEFPISILKIDRTFTKGIFEDQSEKHITESIVGLAKNFNMLVVAEGVEEKRQVEYLQSIGCNFIQGFYFGKPMPENEVVSLLKSGRKLQL